MHLKKHGLILDIDTFFLSFTRNVLLAYASETKEYCYVIKISLKIFGDGLTGERGRNSH